MFTVTIEGEAELRSAWGSVTNLVRDGVSRGVYKGTREGAEEARTRHAFKTQSGELETSIVGTSEGLSGDTARGRIVASSQHASHVEYDTVAHIIRPRKKNKSGRLHWERPQGDHHFALVVNHPGTRGQPFMHIAYFKCEAVIMREVEIAIAKAAEVLAR